MTQTYAALAAAALLLIGQQPRFQSSIDLTPIDVAVIDDHGKPIPNLTPADFKVSVNGAPRRVVSAEWIPMTAPAKAPVVVPAGYSSNENATGGRLIMIALDETNIGFGQGRGLTRAAAAFVDHLTPSDRVGAIGFGTATAAVGFTADRERVKQNLAKMVGQKNNLFTLNTRRNVSLAEALLIENNDSVTSGAVVGRECAQYPPGSLAWVACKQEVLDMAHQMAMSSQVSAETTIRGLRDLLESFKAIDGPKTLIVMSEGFVVDNTTSWISEIGALAATAHTSIYAVQVDDQQFDVTNTKVPMTPMQDRQRTNEGLETLVGASRGALFRLVGDPAGVFDRIESELAGYYLLGVETDPRDRDGTQHPIKVEVAMRGATVRARRQVLTPAAAIAPAAGDAPSAAPPAPSGRATVIAGLNAPLLLTSLPLRIVTYSLQGPDQAKVQLLIHAEIGNSYTAPARVSVGFIIADGQGKVVETQGADMRLSPPIGGLPSPLTYLAGASVPPGNYTLKIVASDGEKAGSVEHPIRAALVDAGSVKLSELMAGDPLDGNDIMRPMIGYKITYGSVQGYVEAYGPDSHAVEATYEIASDDASPALLSAEVPPRRAGEDRVLFTRVMSVAALPPGKYVLRAVLTKDGQPLKTMSRAFEMAMTVIPASEAVAADAPSKDGELFLPAGDAPLAGPFRVDDALKPATVEPFLAHLAPTGKDAFDRGVAAVAAHDYQKAEQSFKAAMRPDGDMAGALPYLAVTYAASGHDAEAASAWQTSLVDGAEIPQIYQWLADALMRGKDLAAARSVLEEAAEKWPKDARFARPLALLYASFGRGREAVRTLERYIADAGTHDADALATGIEWIYRVHAAGAVVHNPADDVALARRYADQYKGPKQALVKQWIDALKK
jgi:VWFA-related protein